MLHLHFPVGRDGLSHLFRADEQNPRIVPDSLHRGTPDFRAPVQCLQRFGEAALSVLGLQAAVLVQRQAGFLSRLLRLLRHLRQAGVIPGKNPP